MFSKDGGTIVAYPAGKKADVYEIPSTVKVIGKDAFAGSYIKSFVISEGVEKIEKDAFFNMRGHCDTITIPASVTYIGSGAFKYGYEVNTVNFTKGTKLSTFPSNAFSDEHLTINIPCDVNWSFTEEETKRIMEDIKKREEERKAEEEKRKNDPNYIPPTTTTTTTNPTSTTSYSSTKLSSNQNTNSNSSQRSALDILLTPNNNHRHHHHPLRHPPPKSHKSGFSFKFGGFGGKKSGGAFGGW